MKFGTINLFFLSVVKQNSSSCGKILLRPYYYRGPLSPRRELTSSAPSVFCKSLCDYDDKHGRMVGECETVSGNEVEGSFMYSK